MFTSSASFVVSHSNHLFYIKLLNSISILHEAPSDTSEPTQLRDPKLIASVTLFNNINLASNVIAIREVSDKINMHSSEIIHLTFKTATDKITNL